VPLSLSRVGGAAEMFKWRGGGDRGKAKAVFKLQFHATQARLNSLRWKQRFDFSNFVRRDGTWALGGCRCRSWDGRRWWWW
jgi:hypothetical protein